LRVAAALARPAVARRACTVDRLLQASVFIGTVLLVAVPVVPILYQSVLDRPLYDPARTFTLANYARLLLSGEFWRVVTNTLLFAGMSTALALLLGTAFAVLLTRTDLPGRGWLAAVFTAPLYLSPLVLAFAWVVLFGPQGYLTILVRSILGVEPWQLYSLSGMAVLGGSYYAPFAYLYCVGALALSDPALEDAARIAGAGPLRTLWRVTLPLLRPALLYSGLLIFIGSLEVLSIPLVLGTPVGIELFSSYLYKLGVVGVATDYGVIAASSVLILSVMTLLVLLQERLLGSRRRFVTVTGRVSRARILSLGALRWPLGVACSAYALVVIVLPLLGLGLRSFTAFLSPLANPLDLLTLDNFRLVFGHSSYVRSIWNSLVVAAVGGAVGIAFMGLATLVALRSDFPGRRALVYVALYPRAIPGIIVGVGFLWAFLMVPGLGGVRNTLVGLTLAFVMRYIPYGFGAVAPAILRVGEELDRAARIAGADWTTTVRRILLPLLRGALASGYALLFITFLKEYASAVFLFARGSEVMGTTMIELWRQGDSGPVAALAVVQLVLTALGLALAHRIGGTIVR
jgi:iron(III) transport system permease protein